MPHQDFQSASSSTSFQSSRHFMMAPIASVVAFSLTLMMTSFGSLPAHAFSMGGEHPCTYDFELQTSTMRVSCPGSPSVVNVYADTARLQAQDLQEGAERKLAPGGPSSHKAGGWTGHGSSGGAVRHIPERNHGYYNPGEDPFANYVWNASKRLDEARRSLTGYSNSLQNITVRMAEGHINLQHDMNHLMRSTDTASKLKEGIVAAMTNQFNFMRAVLLSRNEELQKLVTTLAMLVEVTSQGMHSAHDTHRILLDRVGYLNDTLVSVRSMLTSELRKKDKRRRRAGKKGKKSRPKGEPDQKQTR